MSLLIIGLHFHGCANVLRYEVHISNFMPRVSVPNGYVAEKVSDHTVFKVHIVPP
jgi:hypothetical protein